VSIHFIQHHVRSYDHRLPRNLGRGLESRCLLGRELQDQDGQLQLRRRLEPVIPPNAPSLLVPWYQHLADPLFFSATDATRCPVRSRATRSPRRARTAPAPITPLAFSVSKAAARATTSMLAVARMDAPRPAASQLSASVTLPPLPCSLFYKERKGKATHA
jgi:hypothetical protein